MKSILFLLICSTVINLYAVSPEHYPMFEDAVTFYHSFDHNRAASDIACGSEIPLGTVGTVKFAPGLRGNAMICGPQGACLRFLRAKNITFDRPGTLLFFFKGIDWEKTSGSRVLFSGIESGSGFLGLQMSYGPSQFCPCQRDLHLQTLYSKTIPAKTFVISRPFAAKSCNQWHMIAFSWAPGELRINIDDKPAKSFDIKFDFNDAGFPSKVFSVGNHTHWNYLMDEFTVYNRRLTQSELAKIYKSFTKNAQ